MGDEEKNEESKGVVKGTVDWVKEHPKVSTAVGAAAAASAGAYGYDSEKVNSVFTTIMKIFGFL